MMDYIVNEDEQKHNMYKEVEEQLKKKKHYKLIVTHKKCKGIELIVRNIQKKIENLK